MADNPHKTSFLFKSVFVPILAVFCVACGVFIGAAFSRKAANGSAEPPAPAAEDRTVNVQVLPLQPGPIQELIVLPCSVEPDEDIALASELSGRIDAVGAEEGDAVHKDQMIVTCDVRTYEARREEAAAARRLAELTIQRLEQLQKDGFTSANELDKARTDLDTKTAALRLAEIELDKATIRSPIDGTLDERAVDVGEHVNPGQMVARIVSTSKVKAVVFLPEVHVAFIRPGDQVGVQFPYLDTAVPPMLGRVAYLATVADASSRTYRMDVALGNPQGTIRPGMIGKVYLQRRQFSDALSVPLFAVIAKDGRRVVAVEESGIAHLRDVTLGITDGTRIQVTGGLKPGDRLIVAGHRDLQDGDAVRVMAVADSPTGPLSAASALPGTTVTP